MQKRGKVWASCLAGRRSQVAVEYLVIMAFVLVILIGIISLNQGLMDSFGGQFQASKARIAVDDLADAADSVYTQGVGAQTRVFVSIPSGVTSSAVSNRTIQLSLTAPSNGRNDIYRNLNFQVNGFLPTQEGNYWLTVRAMSGYVMIGYALVDISPPGISLILGPGNSSTIPITLRNIVNYTVGVSLTYSIDPELNLSLSQSSLLLSQNATSTILANISVSPLADEDTETGMLTVTANTTQGTQVTTLPITVMIVGAACGACLGNCSLIQLYPDLWDLGNITRNNLYPGTFFVCNGFSQAQSVLLNFTNTSYIGFDTGVATKTQLLQVGAGNCSTTTVYVNTSSANFGSYSTLLSAIATNGSDVSTILFRVINITQTIPIVNLISPADNATIRARWVSLTYNVTSNNSINSCSLILNGAQVSTYPNALRNVTNSFNLSNLQNGLYNWTVSCTDTTGGVGTASLRWLTIRVLSLYAVPALAWDESGSPVWTTEVQVQLDGSYATQVDEGVTVPDYIEFQFPNIYMNDTNSIKSVGISFLHLDDEGGGFWDVDLRHEVECYNGSAWLSMGVYNNDSISGGVDSHPWLFSTNPNLINCSTSPSVINNFLVRVTFDPAYGTGGIQYIDWAQIEVNYTDVLYPNLWPMAIDQPQYPVGFTTGLNTTANTFGWKAGDDGWDWMRNAYGGSLNATSFNEDPNMDGSIADSTVAADKQLKIKLGGGTPGAPANKAPGAAPVASGAYGIQFNITPAMYSTLTSGTFGNAYLSFDWTMNAHAGGTALAAGDAAWMKARLTNPSNVTTWLGSNLDGASACKDAFNELWYMSSPVDSSGHLKLNITTYILQSGMYYLDLGSMIGGWGSATQTLGAYFDNLTISVVPN